VLSEISEGGGFKHKEGDRSHHPKGSGPTIGHHVQAPLRVGNRKTISGINGPIQMEPSSNAHPGQNDKGTSGQNRKVKFREEAIAPPEERPNQKANPRRPTSNSDKI
jgi:hypothetical protein